MDRKTIIEMLKEFECDSFYAFCSEQDDDFKTMLKNLNRATRELVTAYSVLMGD